MSTPSHVPRLTRSWILVAAGIIALVALLLVARSSRSHHSAPAHATPSVLAGQVKVPPAAYIPDAPILPRTGWTVTASDQAAGHPADAALDSNAFSYWDSRGPLSRIGPSPSITIDMHASRVVSAIMYEPRQADHPVGAIGQFEVAISADGVHFKTVATGTWADTTATKEVGIDAVTTRFVRLTARSAAAGAGSDIAAAEIYLRGTPHVTPASKSDAKLTDATLSTNPGVVGQWGPTIGFPLVPVAAALLPDNEMLVWSADQDLAFGATDPDDWTQTAILNLTTGAVSEDTVTNTDHNMFCPGVVLLPDGDVMVTGGLSDQQTSIYDPQTNAWSAGPPMNIGRGYQGMTLLSNGQAFTLGGSWSGGLGSGTDGKLGEVWSPSGGWRELTGVPATPMYTQDAQGVYRADNEGWFIATSGGNVLQAGPSSQMNWISTSGTGSITPAGTRGDSADAMNGDAVYYDIDKVITMGGAPDYQDADATNSAYEIQIGTPPSPPQVTQVGSMNYARAFANSVVLPTGQVVTMGGQSYALPFSDEDSILNPELWDPSTGDFTVMAPEAEPRNYHSVALLLPDGTVFSGGGGLCGSCSTNHPDGQIWSPPYLFNADGTPATRPTITTAPTSAATGQTISVTTGGPVSQFSMVRYGVTTHTMDNDQRRIPLSIVSSSGDTYQLAIPSDPGIALPGPYMLFAINAAGTPSVSTTISVTNVSTPPPADSYGQAVFGSGPALYWPLDDASGPTAADLSGNGDTGSYSSGGITYGAPSPVEGASGSGVTLDGASGQIVASQPITDPTTYSEEMWFDTTTDNGGLLSGFGTSPSGMSDSRDRMVWMSNDGQLNFGVYNAQTEQTVVVQSPQSYNNGAWHHVVATQGPDGMNLYVDGQLVGSNDNTQAQSYLGYWRVGGENLAGWPDSPTSNYFAGTISDVAFYNSELSASQVLTHYQATGYSCPTGWTCTDIGGPLPLGQQTQTGSNWSVSGGGGDIWGTADAFHFVDQSLAADGTVTAQVSAQAATDPWAKAGVMLRATADPGSPYYAAFTTPGHGVAVQWRSAQGGSSSQVTAAGTVPTYLRIGRYTAGSTVYYTAYTSPDGTTWTAVPGSTQTVTGLTGTLLAGLAVTSHDQGTSSTVGFGTVSVTATEYPPPGYSCPTGWTCTDIGGPLPLGQQTQTGSNWSVSGGGGDIWGTADAFHFVNQSLAADGTVTAQVSAQAATDPWAKAGVMLRATADPGSPYYAAFTTPGHGVAVQWRSAQGGSSSQVTAAGTVPTYLRIGRYTAGSTVYYTAYTSPDGTTWTAVPGSTQTVTGLTGTLLAGLAVTSHDQGTSSTVGFGTVSVTATEYPPPGLGPLPSPWASTDVGGPQVAGESTYAGGTYTVNGSGSDIWGGIDQFQYAYQPLDGDGTIVAQVTSQTDTDPWAKAGIMIKQSTTAGDPYALLAVTPDNGINMQYGFDANVAGSSDSSDAWLELSRNGNTFTAYDSSDGSTWTEVGSTTISMATDATVGLFVSSHNSGQLGTATFDNVTVTPGDGGPLPSPWASTDVGGPQVAGESTYAGGTYTVNGSGSDIWGGIDQFQYAYQPLDGDGTIVAQVTSQTDTDPWAKAGIMIKQSTTAGDPYALLAVTPDNGINMQYGFDANVAGSSDSSDAWLELSRNGNTFTAYDSSDGSTWTEVGSTTISMATDATVGLFVSSHNSGQLGTATFDNVTVTPGDGLLSLSTLLGDLTF